MKPRALAIANNDIVYLWWTYPEPIADCLGFSIRRIQDGKAPEALRAYVGLTPEHTKNAAGKWNTTDLWPIRSYQWKDLFVPEETDVRYDIVPMIQMPGKAPVPNNALTVSTGTVKATDTYGPHQVVFNRGIISTQSLSATLKKGASGGPSKDDLKRHIEKPGDKIRARLAGEALATLTSLFEKARREGGRCYCALYELTDPELIASIKKYKDLVEIILSNADSSKTVNKKTVKVYDGTNQETRKVLRRVLGPAFHDRFLQKGNYIGHNKFVVYTDAGGAPREVLTGSTNWTPTGLCTQSNNILVLRNPDIAATYMEYWRRLLKDSDQDNPKSRQGPELREADAVSNPTTPLGPTQGTARIWFSPNTPQKSKPKTDPTAPPDMSEVFQVIEQANCGVLFLLFSAGAPSILQKIDEVSKQRLKDGGLYFVRGAISDQKTANQFSTRVYNDSILKAPNLLITGIGGINDQYDKWEKELAKYGNAVIHDKIVVADPFTDKCVVVTGSHNLGFKASYSNDENLCILRGNQEIAAAYATHVLDIVNHFNWRYASEKEKKTSPDMKKKVGDLYNLTTWQEKYYKGNFLENRDMFFFPV